MNVRILDLSYVFKVLSSLQFTSTFSHLGQSYEIRMLDNRKAGELPELNNKMVKVRAVKT